MKINYESTNQSYWKRTLTSIEKKLERLNANRQNLHEQQREVATYDKTSAQEVAQAQSILGNLSNEIDQITNEIEALVQIQTRANEILAGLEN